MAANALTFSLFGKDVSASKTFEGVANAADKAGGVFKGMASVAGGALAAIGITASLGAVKDYLGESVEAYKEAELSQLQLTTAYEKFPAMASMNIAALQDLNSELALKTRFDDDAFASGQALLGQFGLTGQQIADLTPLLADYAARTGKDLPSAAEDLGKAMLGQGKALKSIGLDFKDAGSTGANFDQVMAGLSAQVGGFAEKDGAAGAGMTERLNNQMGELQETIGGGLLPIIQQLQGAFLTYVVPVLAQVAESVAGGVGPAFTSLIGFIMPLVQAIGGVLGPIFAALGPQLLDLAMAFSPLQFVLGALQPVLPILATLLQTIAGVLSGVLGAVLPIVSTLIERLAGVLSGVLAAALPSIAALVTQLGGVIEQLMPTIMLLASRLGDTLMTVLTALAPLITALMPIFGQLITALMPIIDPILSIVTAFLPLITVLGELIGALLPPIISLLMALLTPILALIEPLMMLLVPALEFVATVISTVVGWITEFVNQFIGMVAGTNTAGEGLRLVFAQIWAFLQPILAAIGAGIVAVGTGITQAFSGIGSFIGDVFRNVANFVSSGINKVIDMVNTAISGINELGKAASEVTGGAISWSVNKIPRIPMLAAGGIVSSATLAMIGEGREPEVVAPLSKLPGMLQAAGLGGNGGSSAPTVLEFHGDAAALQQLFAIYERKTDGTRVLVSKMGKQR